MRTTPVRQLILLTALAGSLSAAEQIGATHVAHWQDDKTAAFMLMFDDSCPSDVKVVVPELTKRGMVGTFYVNPGAGHFSGFKPAWEHDIPAAGMELANHTLTHKGAKSVEEAEHEIGAANDALHAIAKDQPWPRLISFGQPGGVPWTITPAEFKDLLAKNHLVNRPDFGNRGAMIGLKTTAEMLTHVDKTIASKGSECIIFHGVGGDWIVTPLPVFTGLLDGLATRSDKLWLTTAIPAHQYQVERDAATVAAVGKPAGAKPKEITVTLSCTADAALYDLPLTLVTDVPATWKACSVTQGGKSVAVTAVDGVLRYHALPGKDPITLSPSP